MKKAILVLFALGTAVLSFALASQPSARQKFKQSWKNIPDIALAGFDAIAYQHGGAFAGGLQLSKIFDVHECGIVGNVSEVRADGTAVAVAVGGYFPFGQVISLNRSLVNCLRGAEAFRFAGYPFAVLALSRRFSKSVKVTDFEGIAKITNLTPDPAMLELDFDWGKVLLAMGAMAQVRVENYPAHGQIFMAETAGVEFSIQANDQISNRNVRFGAENDHEFLLQLERLEPARYKQTMVYTAAGLKQL